MRYKRRYIMTWGSGGPDKTIATDDWEDALLFFRNVQEWNPTWLDPSGQWLGIEDRKWLWVRGCNCEPLPPYEPLPPVTISGPREVTRYDYWEDIPLWEEVHGRRTSVLFKGEKYAIQQVSKNRWKVWRDPDASDELIGIVVRGVSGEYWAGPTGWETNVCGNLLDTLRSLMRREEPVNA